MLTEEVSLTGNSVHPQQRSRSAIANTPGASLEQIHIVTFAKMSFAVEQIWILVQGAACINDR